MLKKKLISSIEGKELNGYVLKVANISRGRFVEETNFELFLKNAEGETSENPAVRGTHFSGQGEYYKPWLEIYYYNHVSFSLSKILDLSEEGLDEKMFEILSQLLPPGAHIMVVYLNHEETRKGLERGVPPAATPFGYLLWKSGFPAQDERTKKVTGKAATYAFFIGSYSMVALMIANLINLELTGLPLLDVGYALVIPLLVQSLTFLGLRLYFNRKGEF